MKHEDRRNHSTIIKTLRTGVETLFELNRHECEDEAAHSPELRAAMREILDEYPDCFALIKIMAGCDGPAMSKSQI